MPCRLECRYFPRLVNLLFTPWLVGRHEWPKSTFSYLCTVKFRIVINDQKITAIGRRGISHALLCMACVKKIRKVDGRCAVVLISEQINFVHCKKIKRFTPRKKNGFSKYIIRNIFPFPFRQTKDLPIQILPIFSWLIIFLYTNY